MMTRISLSFSLPTWQCITQGTVAYVSAPLYHLCRSHTYTHIHTHRHTSTLHPFLPPWTLAYLCLVRSILKGIWEAGECGEGGEGGEGWGGWWGWGGCGAKRLSAETGHLAGCGSSDLQGINTAEAALYKQSGRRPNLPVAQAQSSSPSQPSVRDTEYPLLILWLTVYVHCICIYTV